MSHVNGTDQQLTGELREYLLAKGADLVGFGLGSVSKGVLDVVP